MVWNVLKPFRYFRCTARVRFQVSGNAFMGGKLIAAWIPPNRVNAACDGWNTLTTISGIPQRVEMYPTENSTYELEIPLLLSSRWLDLDQTVNGPLSWLASFDNDEAVVSLGVVAVWVAAQLVSEDAIDSCSVSMFVSLENFQLENAYRLNFPSLTPPSAAVPPIANYLPFGGKYLNQVGGISFGIDPTLAEEDQVMIRKGVKQVFNVGDSLSEAKVKESTGWISGPLRTIAALATVFRPFTGVYSPLVAAGTATVSGLASVLSFFKLDKPRMLMLPTQVIRNYRNMAHGDGVDQVNSIALSSDNAVIPVGLNQPFDPEALKICRIASIPQVIDSTNVTTSMAANTVITQWSVAPWNVPLLGFNSALTKNSNKCYAWAPTFAYYAALPFRFWRGTCVVDVEVVAQGFSKMYLGLTWQPGFGEFATPPTTVSSGTETELMTQIVQVSGNTKARFVIPYKACSHWLRTDLNSQFNPNNAAAGARSKTGRVNGTFTLYIVNPLTSYSASGPNNNPVTIFTSVSFPDLQVARPTGESLCSSRGVIYALGTPGFAVTDGEKKEKDKKQVFNVADKLSGDSGPAEPSAQLSESHWFGDKIESILDITRRPSSIGYVSQFDRTAMTIWSLFTATGHSVRAMPVLDPASTNAIGSGNPLPQSLAVWFSNIFLAWRGEVSYQVANEPGYFRVGTSKSDSDETYSVRMINVDAWGGVPYPYLEGGTQENISYAPSTSAYTDGMSWRPTDSTAMPATAAVPYYSENTFIHTLDYGLPHTTGTTQRYNLTPYTIGTIPGVSISTTSSFYTVPDGDSVPPITYSILASTGDNFSYGALYPPGTITDYINAISTAVTYVSPNNYQYPGAWITGPP